MKTRFLLFACAAHVLSGCSTWLVDPDSPPDDSSQHATYVGSGIQQFQCVADKRGYYWRFVAPEVLIRDASGNVFAKQGADFTFRAADGSYLKATISAADTSGSNSRMKNVLFEVTPRGNPAGTLSQFRWVKRTDATGGIPTIPCRRNTLGTFLKVPFHATYAFFR